MKFSKVFFLILFLMFLNGCTSTEQHKDVSYIKVSQSTRKHKQFHGYVKSQLISTLSFQSEGKIIFLPYTKGDFVKKGQVLARLNGDLYKIKKNEEQAGLQNTIVQYNKAKSYYKRMDILHKEGAISDNDWEDAYYGLKSLDEQIKIQKEKLNYLEKEISYSILVAPFDGYISEKFSEIGAYAKIGDPILSIIGTNQTQVETMVDSRTVNSINPKDAVIIRTYDKVYSATVTHVSKTSINSGGYLVKINLDKLYPELKDGMSVDVEIPSFDKTVLYYIPLNCVFKDGKDEKYVFKIINVKNNVGEVKKEKIQTGQITNDEIEIQNGVSKNDLIISDDLEKFSPGIKVKL